MSDPIDLHTREFIMDMIQAFKRRLIEQGLDEIAVLQYACEPCPALREEHGDDNCVLFPGEYTIHEIDEMIENYPDDGCILCGNHKISVLSFSSLEFTPEACSCNGLGCTKCLGDFNGA